MKKILLVLVMLTLSLSAGTGSGLGAAMESQITTNLTWVWTVMKLFGFAIIIWGVTDLISENQQQQNAGGSKYIKAIMKIMVGGVLVASGTLYSTITA